MIYFSAMPNIRVSSQKVGKLGIHHRRQIVTHDFFDVQTYHLKKLLRSLLNALENLRNFVYRNLQFHGASSFDFRFLGKNPLKEKRLFFYPFLAPYNFTQNILHYHDSEGIPLFISNIEFLHRRSKSINNLYRLSSLDDINGIKDTSKDELKRL